MTPEAILARLLAAVFNQDELRNFIIGEPEGISLSNALPGPSASMDTLTVEFVTLLRRRGLLDVAFFERLKQARPRRHFDIHKALAAWTTLEMFAPPQGGDGVPMGGRLDLSGSAPNGITDVQLVAPSPPSPESVGIAQVMIKKLPLITPHSSPESEIIRLETRIIEGERRLIPALLQLLDSRKQHSPTDPRRRAAHIALLWCLFPFNSAASGVGFIGLALVTLMVFLAYFR